MTNIQLPSDLASVGSKPIGIILCHFMAMHYLVTLVMSAIWVPVHIPANVASRFYQRLASLYLVVVSSTCQIFPISCWSINTLKVGSLILLLVWAERRNSTRIGLVVNLPNAKYPFRAARTSLPQCQFNAYNLDFR